MTENNETRSMFTTQSPSEGDVVFADGPGVTVEIDINASPEEVFSNRSFNLGVPDKHNGCSTKTSEFKVVTEAYNILSNYKLRLEYDRWLDDVIVGENGQVVRRRKEGASRAAERNPFYRKVYSPAAPPGMKTFDRQRHYGMYIVLLLCFCVCVCLYIELCSMCI